MSFSPITFETHLIDIETYLGYLRGNENAWKYLEEVQASVELSPDGVTTTLFLDEGYQFPCPESQYAVTPYDGGWSMAITTYEDQDFDRDAYIKEVQAQASKAWEDGEAWAKGVADYCRSVCDQFTQPDVALLKAQVDGMQSDVLNKLVLEQTDDNWAKIGLLSADWHGDSATEFNNFYTNFNDVQARLGRFLFNVNMGFAMSARMIAGVQAGAQTTLEEFLKGIKAQLASWAEADRKPAVGGDLLPPWVGDAVGLAGDVLGLAEYLPVVGSTAKAINDIRDKGSQISSVVSGIEDLSGKEFMPAKEKEIPVETAEQIYTGLTEGLYDDYLEGYQDGMDKLDTAGGGAGTFSGQTLVNAMREAKNDQSWDHDQVKGGSLRHEDDEYY